MIDRSEAALRSIKCPEIPPTLAAAARRRASEIEVRTSRRRRTRTAALGASALILVGVGFTAPGQAATEWIAEVAGIGDEPTLEHPDGVPGSTVVFGTGTAPDGTPFEIVAERQSAETFNARLREVRGDDDVRIDTGLICPRIDFPSHQVSSGEFCSVLGSGPGPSGLGGMGISTSRDGASSPAPLWGEVGPEVAEVRMLLAVPGEPSRELEVALAHLSGGLQQQVGADHPFGVFVGFPPIDSLPAISVDGPRLEVIAYDDAGEEVDRQGFFVGGRGVGALPAHPPILGGAGN